jgi:hypothetical protein
MEMRKKRNYHNSRNSFIFAGMNSSDKKPEKGTDSPSPPSKGLDDKELAKKYDNGEKVKFKEVIKTLVKPRK